MLKRAYYLLCMKILLYKMTLDIKRVLFISFIAQCKGSMQADW